MASPHLVCHHRCSFAGSLFIACFDQQGHIAVRRVINDLPYSPYNFSFGDNGTAEPGIPSLLHDSSEQTIAPQSY